MRCWLVRIAILAACSLAPASRADVFSPGPLAKSHEDLEGLTNCTKCHAPGGQLSSDRCLDCHKEIQVRVAKKHGLHGLLSDAERNCNLCHHEHQGRDFQLVDWGKGGKSGFDHKRTGFPLLGKHAPLKCDQCHQDKMIVDSGVRELKKKFPKIDTYLGVANQCASCHFDEHRGQFNKKACSTCHDEHGWKPAPKFNHAKTSFPLEGKHEDVKCVDCHAREKDPHFSKSAFPAPLSEAFSRFRPVVHDKCTDCHKDPHQNRFGQICESCHSVEGWLVLHGAAGERAFHEKTRYPLRGAHVAVPCKSCHGPFPGKKAVFKGMIFDACTACHVDAHLAQLGKAGDPYAACDRCHTVQSFRPAKYDPEEHKSWPLLGSHGAVACQRCHAQDPTLETRAAPLRDWLDKRKRKALITLTQFHPPGNPSRCDMCHTDPHKGQFQQRVQDSGCADCHQVASWSQVSFDHDRETRFPLTGGHKGPTCPACHVPDGSGVVRYAEVQRTCSSCHADAHVGQFAAAKTNATDCTRCHASTKWQEISFLHKPPFTSYELTGKHASVECANCHPEIFVAYRTKTRRYRGVPTSCEGCHVDVHKGAFGGLTR